MAYSFNAAATRDALVTLIRNLAQKQGFSKVVLGISGGKDSTVCAALCARALGRENVYGVMLPDGEQKDISGSIRVCEVLGIRRRFGKNAILMGMNFQEGGTAIERNRQIGGHKA